MRYLVNCSMCCWLSAPRVPSGRRSSVSANKWTHERGLIGTLRAMRTPLLTWENDLLDDLALAGLQRYRDFGEVEKGHYLWLVRASHPLAAGLPAGLNTWMVAASRPVLAAPRRGPKSS